MNWIDYISEILQEGIDNYKKRKFEKEDENDFDKTIKLISMQMKIAAETGRNSVIIKLKKLNDNEIEELKRIFAPWLKDYYPDSKIMRLQWKN